MAGGSKRDLFDKERVHPAPDEYLRGANPWWVGRRGRVLPSYRRWLFGPFLQRLKAGLAPVVVLRGARQVGKTTLQEQIIEHLIRQEGFLPKRILRIQFDEIPSLRLRGLVDPVLAVSRWFENRILGCNLNEAARRGEPPYLFLDAVHNLEDWAPPIKSLVDHNSVRVAVTGSSALGIEAGRDSLAGRVTTLEISTLLRREIAGLRFGAELDPGLPRHGLEPGSRPSFGATSRSTRAAPASR